MLSFLSQEEISALKREATFALFDDDWARLVGRQNLCQHF